MKIIIKKRIFHRYIWLVMKKLSWQFSYFLHLIFILKKTPLTFLFFSLGVYKCNKVTHENIFFFWSLLPLIFTLSYIIIRSIFDSIYFHWKVKVCYFSSYNFFLLFKTEKSRSNLKNKIYLRNMIFFLQCFMILYIILQYTSISWY